MSTDDRVGRKIEIEPSREQRFRIEPLSRPVPAHHLVGFPDKIAEPGQQLFVRQVVVCNKFLQAVNELVG
jgi:hypothetical protein